ncbi:MAG: hypothetical protein PWQ82_237 [Thermosediminibacterales bacterium]|nr:hypothetical protein [Thermosediminibacterales bacterium]MDK2835259.1 hypothetical protein [Thermosediminibacterales bacterium]
MIALGSFENVEIIFLFILTYCFIVTEKINRTVAAFLSVALMFMLKLIDFEYAIESIDFNTIGLLLGMMIIVVITKKSGFFQYIAIKAAKISRGEPLKILFILCIITAVCSAFLDNVTTVLLIAPVTLVITDVLSLNPISFLIPEIFVSNVGGTATLIGDPPNIMIGSAAALGFVDFLKNLSPAAFIILFVTIFVFKIIYGKQLQVSEKNKIKILDLDERKAIKDKTLLIKSLTVIALTMLGFLLHQNLELESSMIALIGAAFMLLISGVNPEEVFREIEWPTIFFFAFLFIIVGALEKTGVLQFFAYALLSLTNNNILFLSIFILWGGALFSAFLDNIPFVATMIPLIQNIHTISGINISPLWWALALGACLGGNGTLVGASANVVVAGILEKHQHKLSFMDYFKTGFPLMIMTIIISTIYILIFIL